MKCSEWDSKAGTYGLDVQHPNPSATLPPNNTDQTVSLPILAPKSTNIHPKNPHFEFERIVSLNSTAFIRLLS